MEGMATHSSLPACRIPWTEEPGGLWSTGPHRIRHDWSNLARRHVFFPYRAGSLRTGQLLAVADFIFLGSEITADGDCSYEIKRLLLLGRKTMTNLDSLLKSRDLTLLTKVCISQRYGFSSRHVRMWELNHKEGWVLKNWCFRPVLLEKTIKESVGLQGDQTSQS